MDMVFNVDIYDRNSRLDGAGAEFWLPARPYELRSALQRARADESSVLNVSIYDYGRAEFISGTFLSPQDARMLRGLNALAWKVTEMTETELAGFEGLVCMESGEDKPALTMERLYNLAASGGNCHAMFDVTDDEQLGRFFAENGFTPELDSLPDEVFERLDFRKIGAEKRQEHGGVFLEDAEGVYGYVEHDGDIVDAWKDLNLDPEEPDYAVLMELRRTDTEEHSPVTLKLPADESAIRSAMAELDVTDWTNVSTLCLDCKVPAIGEMLAELNNPEHASRVAIILNRLTAEQAVVCDALLEAVPCPDLPSAITMMRSVDAYTLTPELSTHAEYAKRHILNLVGEESAQYLIPCVDVQTYGSHLLSKGTAAMTAYGAIQRKDGQLLRAPLDQARNRTERPMAEPDQTGIREQSGGVGNTKKPVKRRQRRKEAAR